MWALTSTSYLSIEKLADQATAQLIGHLSNPREIVIIHTCTVPQSVKTCTFNHHSFPALNIESNVIYYHYTILLKPPRIRIQVYKQVLLELKMKQCWRPDFK